MRRDVRETALNSLARGLPLLRLGLHHPLSSPKPRCRCAHACPSTSLILTCSLDLGPALSLWTHPSALLVEPHCCHFTALVSQLQDCPCLPCRPELPACLSSQSCPHLRSMACGESSSPSHRKAFGREGVPGSSAQPTNYSTVPVLGALRSISLVMPSIFKHHLKYIPNILYVK